MSHVSQRLRNNQVTRGRHTLVYLTAQTPLRMHKTPPDVKLAGWWNNLKQLLLHWTLLYRAALLRLLPICTRPSPTTKLTWIWLWWCHRYVTAIKQRMFERGRQEVDTKSPSYLKGNELITCLQDKINFISCRLQSTNNTSFQKSYCLTETKWYGIQKIQGIKHTKQI